MSAIRPGVGELEICELCDSSPHVVGCPRHSNYADDRIIYVRVDVPADVGTAKYWVEDTFALAAQDASEGDQAALKEAIDEFQTTLKRGELQRM